MPQIRIMRAAAGEDLIVARVEALSLWLPRAARGEIASVRKARTATRRLRAVLATVANGRKAKQIAGLVRRVTQALGPVRELDVALGMIDDFLGSGALRRSTARALAATITRERRQLGSTLARELEGFDIDRLRRWAVAVARADDAPRRGLREAKRAAGAAHEQAGRRAERLLRLVERAAGLYLPERLHEVRIAVKKLRYAVEVERHLAGSKAKAALRGLTAAQDVLGRMHDLEVLIARARATQASPGTSGPGVIADLDRLVRRLEAECSRLHEQYVASRKTLQSICRRAIARGGASRTRTPAA